MYCTHCGTQLPSEARFCHRCGAPAQGSFPRRPAGGPAPKKLTRTEVLLLALDRGDLDWRNILK